MAAMPLESDSTFLAARRRLFSIAYRMLGSTAEAEDVVQETWLRWHRADREVLEQPVAWLTTVATRIALDRLRRLRRERDAAKDAWLPEPWLDACSPSPEDALSLVSELSYSVMLLFERLTPDERAALLLHDVFDCQYEEIARILDRKPDHCRQLARRAREHVQSNRVRQRAGAASDAELVQDLLVAIRNQDKDALVRLIAPGAQVVGNAGAAPTASLAQTQPAARFVAALLAFDQGAYRMHAACINNGWGIVFTQRGSIELTLSLEIDGARIRRIFAYGRPVTHEPVLA
jgi:RNA polymerase sigma-70 factor (ECF subfamily)